MLLMPEAGAIVGGAFSYLTVGDCGPAPLPPASRRLYRRYTVHYGWRL